MSNNTKNEVTRIVTPTGNLCWVRITGEGEKQDNGDFKYLATVKYKNDSKELAELKAELQKFWDNNKPNDKAPATIGIRAEKVDDVETDYSLVTFKAKTTLSSGDAKKVRLLDNDKKTLVLDDGTGIGNNSQGKLSGSAHIYTNKGKSGVTLYLNAIQVQELEVFEYQESEYDDGF
jgi:hypothetical protein